MSTNVNHCGHNCGLVNICSQMSWWLHQNGGQVLVQIELYSMSKCYYHNHKNWGSTFGNNVLGGVNGKC